MPDLTRVVAQFSSPLTKEDGTRVKGYLKEPPNVRATYDGLFTARSILLVPPGQNVSAGEVVIDQQGTRFLCGQWTDSNYRDKLICKQLVLFEAPTTLAWSRSVTVADPLTGLKRQTDELALGNVIALKESIARSSDGTDIAETRYRVLVAAPVLLGDYLDKKRVLRVELTLGLTYAETL